MNDNFIIFVDESGDHSLSKINPEFPIFNLVFVVFEQNHYCNVVLPKFNLLKLKYFNSTNVIFHEREIRKSLNNFTILKNSVVRNNFINDVDTFLKNISFEIITINFLKEKNAREEVNIYSKCMEVALPIIQKFLEKNSSLENKTLITFEGRGKQEDRSLELEFLRETKDYQYNNLNIDIITKQSNSTGLQIADLIARPIANEILNSKKINDIKDSNCVGFGIDKITINEMFPKPCHNRAFGCIKPNIYTLQVIIKHEVINNMKEDLNFNIKRKRAVTPP
ncbi:MAG: DUF3800 domain-containing protein [Alphaproteobacteria bacterium]|nr:DUF3800 domain-containing protein [Alphaproteobacteria bacterium]